MTTSRPTLESVARYAKVSRQTVSNVLNNPQRVSATTRERVREAIGELNYAPHTAARQLRTRRSYVIGLRLTPVQDGISGVVLDRFLHALTEGAQAHGYRIMLFTAHDDAAEVSTYAALRRTADLDAFVLTSTNPGDVRSRWLIDHGVPFVTFGRPTAEAGDDAHAWVDVDGAEGTRLAVEHLVRAGHRRIAFVGWPAGSLSGDDRRAGWLAAMAAAGLADQTPGQDVAVIDGVDSGHSAVQRLLSGLAPTAVVCASDSLALGALSAARANGVPLAVVGFDDTPVAAAVGLTSVAQPLTDAAGRVLALLMAQMDPGRRNRGTRHALLRPRLVVRASTTPSP